MSLNWNNLFALLFLSILISCSRAASIRVPLTYVESWCRVTGASPDLSYFVRESLERDTGVQTLVKVSGTVQSEYALHPVRELDEGTLSYSITDLTIAIQRAEAVNNEFPATITVAGVESPATCRSLAIQ